VIRGKKQQLENRVLTAMPPPGSYHGLSGNNSDEPSREELKSEVFTLKMKCHQYEERMKLVNLHGLNGETLQQRNNELEEQLADTTAELRNRSEELENYVALLGKARTAIEKLNTRNQELNAALQEKTVNLEALKNECHDLEQNLATCERDRDTAVDRSRAFEREVIRLEPMEPKARLLPKVCEERDSLQHRVQDLERDLTNSQAEARMAREQAEKEAARLELANLDYQNAQKEFQHEIMRRTEELEQKHNHAQSRYEANLKESELQIKFYEEKVQSLEFELSRYSSRTEELKAHERELVDEVARLKVDLQNAERRETMNMDRFRREIDSERHEAADKAQQELLEVRADLNNQLMDKQRQYESLCTAMASQKEKHRRTVHEYSKKIDDLTSQLETIKKRWKDSISNKRVAQKENIVRSGNTIPTVPSGVVSTSKPSSSRPASTKKTKSTTLKSHTVSSANGTTSAPSLVRKTKTLVVAPKPFR